MRLYTCNNPPYLSILFGNLMRTCFTDLLIASNKLHELGIIVYLIFYTSMGLLVLKQIIWKEYALYLEFIYELNGLTDVYINKLIAHNVSQIQSPIEISRNIWPDQQPN